MKTMSRILVFLLIAALLIPTFIGCVDSGDGSETTTGSADLIPDNSGDNTDYPPSDIPEDLRFDGTTVSFLYWEDVERPEFFVEDTNGESVNDAIYKRNANVEDRFGITLFFDGTPGNYNNQAAFVKACVNSTQSGADAHDLFCGYSMTGATLAVEGIVQDLNEHEIMEFDKPWWPSNLISQVSINEKVYFVSGDISTNYLYMMYGTFFNKEFFVDRYENTETLYTLALDGKWTIDKLIEYSTEIYEDVNSDGTADVGDKYGFMTNSIHLDAFYCGSGLVNLEKTDDDMLALSPDLFSEKTANLVEYLCNFMHVSGDANVKGSIAEEQKAFAESRALFIIDRVYAASGANLKEASFEYGMLPIPKYNEEQESYITCMAFPFTVYALSTASPNPDAAAATLELMAYESFLLITPALFEESMKLRYSDEGYDSQMYDIIRDGVYIDIGRIFSTSLNNLTYNIFRNTLHNNEAGAWASKEKANKAILERLIERVNVSIEELD